MSIFIVDKNGTPLMPTNDWPRIRKYLKNGKAKIFCHRPFTVQLLYREGGKTQPVEFCMDTGYQNIGISIKSETQEYVSEERRLLPDEKKKHQKQKRYRNARRGRLRYRKPQSRRVKCSRKKEKGRLAPSIKNKADRHVDLIAAYRKVCPITSVTLEIGQFDTHVLSAVSQGLPVPEGVDYKHGPMYGHDTLREAVFSRDKYKCKCCGKSAIKDRRILVLHHIGYKAGDRSNRLSNLATVCTKCHTSKNHKKGGKLYDMKPASAAMPQAAFMNTVKWYIYDRVCEMFPAGCVHITYGAVTKRERLNRNIAKTHVNDAYCMGQFHPKQKEKTKYYKKRRRNNRCLEKFYDAKYYDLRDGSIKKGTEIGCNRTNRREPRMSDKNERIYRAHKKSKGKRSIRHKRYDIQSGTILLVNGSTSVAKGIHCKGTRVILDNGKSVSVNKVTIKRHPNGWIPVS